MIDFTVCLPLKRLLKTLLSLGLLLPAMLCFAEEINDSSDLSQPNDPIKIQADSAVFNEKNGSTEYIGTVIMQQGSLEITADLIVILTDDAGLRELIASGNPVRYNQTKTSLKPSIKAEAHKIHYFKLDERMELTGSAFLEQDGQSFSAPRIEYSLDKQTLKALGGTEGENQGRVIMVIPARTTP